MHKKKGILMAPKRHKKNESPEQKKSALSKLIDEFTQAIKSNSKDAAAFLNRGIVHHQQGNYDQAVRDYNKAMRLKPEYDEDETIKYYLDTALKHSIANFNRSTLLIPNSLTQIPDAPSVTTQSSFFDTADTNNVSKTNQRNKNLFKSALALKKLLPLVVRYESDEKAIETAIAAGVNPILQEVNTILMQYPRLALKRDYITDKSGRKKYWSPLEAAHWSGNWELRNLMIEHAQSIPGKEKGKSAVGEQLREWDQQAYDYDLILMRAEKDTFPILKKIPALIKQYNEPGEAKIFQWGDVNGEWQLSELEGDTKELFAHLDFPDTSSKMPVTMKSDQITIAMYDALKKGHTVAHFDLDEYVRVTTGFVNKYPAGVGIPRAQFDECDRDSYKIGRAEKKFPAWLAAVWCAEIPFFPVPDFNLLIKRPDVYRSKLLFYGRDIKDFFDDKLGRDCSIYKSVMPRALSGRGWTLLISPRMAPAVDLVAMAALSKVITTERDKSMQLLLLREAKSTPGLSSR